MGAREPRKRLLNCRVDIGALHVRRGSLPEGKRKRGKRFLGASGGKDWLRKENHEE